MIHQGKASLLDPVLKFGTVFPCTGIVLQAVSDLLKFLLGNSLALLAVSIDILFSDKHFEFLSLIFHQYLVARFWLEVEGVIYD